MAILSPTALKMMRLLTDEVILSIFEVIYKRRGNTDESLRNFYKLAGTIQINKLKPSLKQLSKYGLIMVNNNGTENNLYEVSRKGEEVIKHLEELVKFDQ